MTTRREFLKTTSLTLAGAAAVPAAAAAVSSIGNPSGLGLTSARLKVILDPATRHVIRGRLAKSLENSGADVEWRAVTGHVYGQEADVQMTSRFIDTMPATTLPRDVLSFANAGKPYMNHGFAAASKGLVVNARPQALLVNVRKARQQGINTYTLDGFSGVDAKPIMTISQNKSSAQNDWILPFAQSLGIMNAPFWSGKASRHELEIFHNRVKDYLGKFRVLEHSEPLYDNLIDLSNSEYVAIYGDPIHLYNKLAERGEVTNFAGNYATVAVQDVFGINAPSYFASQYIQVGQTERHNDALRLMSELTLAFSSMDGFDVASGLDIDAANGTMLRQIWQRLSARHNPDAYSNVPNLDILLDGGTLANLMFDLHSSYSIASTCKNGFAFFNTFDAYRDNIEILINQTKYINI